MPTEKTLKQELKMCWITHSILHEFRNTKLSISGIACKEMKEREKINVN